MLKSREAVAVKAGKTFAAYRWTLEQFREWVRERRSEFMGHKPAHEGLWVCAYCSDGLTFDMLTVDHATPIDEGGLTVAENFVLCCQRCNERKGRLNRDDYAKLLQATRSMTPRGRGDVWGRLTRAKQFWRGN